MVLVDRDYQILREIDRFRFCLGRHIKLLTGFEGQRACDRRLKILIEAGYINRKKILYGIPSVYFLTHKGKMLIGANKRQDKIRVEKIPAGGIAVHVIEQDIDPPVTVHVAYQRLIAPFRGCPDILKRAEAGCRICHTADNRVKVCNHPVEQDGVCFNSALAGA